MGKTHLVAVGEPRPEHGRPGWRGKPACGRADMADVTIPSSGTRITCRICRDQHLDDYYEQEADRDTYNRRR